MSEGFRGPVVIVGRHVDAGDDILGSQLETALPGASITYFPASEADTDMRTIVEASGIPRARLAEVLDHLGYAVLN
ncbi:MAG: hypothetical protein US89_C0009G0016 [Candidatus Peregrinibacteria bacterium GW2011_GWF2_38_29]|nr:MAG: hypothetical protein US89_C0009G0016 [Candidatus Peregrinibacteria bacterium GW2011_GWF2_38_29]HBB02804.1 hypothetical protein [Candidatus Peregrinibacteria bacterium]